MKIVPANDRFLSIDVLRGLTICLMILVNTPGSWTYVWAPLKHAEWHGCTPTDLVFPAFLLVIGLSMSFSFRKLEDAQPGTLLIKVLRRSLLIFGIGLLLNWFPFYYKHISDLRIFGVLQRIALSYFVAGVLVVTFRNTRVLIGSIATLLLLHWMVLFYLGGADPFSLVGNISGPIDLYLFGASHIYKGFGIPFDPEGLLGTLGGASHVLIGYLVGRSILSKGAEKTVKELFLIALPLPIIGYLLGMVYPINKPLWTGSYVLYTSGIIFLILAMLIWIIDIKGLKKWTFPFGVFGLNPLASFVLSILVVKILLYIFRFENGNGYQLIYSNVFQPIFGNYWGSFLFAFSYTVLIWLVAFWLYRKSKLIKI